MTQQARAPRPRRQPPVRRRLRRGACMAFAWAIFAVSALPAVLTALKQTGSGRLEASGWYARHVPPVEEMRALAPAPAHWQGHWYDSDRNYAGFERWFADHLALRDLMIRGKNEIDYRLFHSSSRVYYGHDGEMYGRNLADNELPATEHLLDTPAKRAAVEQGVLRFAGQLASQGVTMVLVAPIEKQYFTRERLPFFAPRVPDQSNFIALYERMLAAPSLHMIDVRALLRANQGRFPIFYRQDFHWTDPMAHTVAAAATDAIAALDGAALRWRRPLDWEWQPFTGAEARFAARLNANQPVSEPALRHPWQEPPRQDGQIEFVVDHPDDPALLPPTCMYGNSFSDGMLRAGLTDHFRHFVKFSRAMPLTAVPAAIQGQCRYLIVQVLDIQTDRWASLAR